MMLSPLAFYRGAARVMAADLATMPSSGFLVQACGDAHLSNFGVYASPERQLVFDVNDFDETLPDPGALTVPTNAVLPPGHPSCSSHTCDRQSMSSAQQEETIMADERNVLIMTFPDPAKAFEALSKMKGQPGVAGAAVVERSAQGEVRIADGYAPKVGAGTAVGGLVGALVGIIAGPLGVLLGWSTGMVAGAAYDTGEAADAEDGFTVLSQRIAVSGNALIVEMTETSHAIADDIAGQLNGWVTRIPATEVETEVAAAREAARKAAAEARRVRRENRRAEFKEKVGKVLHHQKAG
jgi:uncharacterized membrane protein